MTVLAIGLHEFLDGLQVKMNTIDECILETFFAQRPLRRCGERLEMPRRHDDFLSGYYP